MSKSKLFIFIVLSLILYKTQELSAQNTFATQFIPPVSSPNCYFVQFDSYNDKSTNPCHAAIDYGPLEATNDEILASSPGKVVKICRSGQSGNNKKCSGDVNDNNCHGLGNTITIKHYLTNGNILYSMYSHLNSFNVYEGEYVQQGQTIGYMGSSGTQDKHLHFEIKIGDVLHNPQNGGPFWGYTPCATQNGNCYNYSGNCTSQPDCQSESYGYLNPEDVIYNPYYESKKIINNGLDIYAGSINNIKDIKINFILGEGITINSYSNFKLSGSGANYSTSADIYYESEEDGAYRSIKVNLPSSLSANGFANSNEYSISLKVNTNFGAFTLYGENQVYFLHPNFGIYTANNGRYEEPYLNLAIWNGFYKGGPIGNINPNGLITRAEAVKVICLIGLQTGYFNSLNTMVSPSESNYNMSGCEWYFPYVQTLINRGVFGGIGDFQHDKPMKYGELCKWLVNTFALESNCADLSKCDNYTGNYCTDGTWESYVKIIEESFTRINFLNVNGALPIDNIGTLRNLELNGSISNTANCNEYIDRKDAAKLFVGTLRYIPLGGVNPSSAPIFKTSTTDVSNWNVIGTKPRLPGNSPNQIPSLPNTDDLGTINDNEFWQSNVGSLYDSNGNALVYYWSIEGGELVSLNNTHFNHIKWIPPTVTETTTFELYVWVGNTKGNYAHTVGTITVNPTDLNCDAPTGLNKQTTSNTQTNLDWNATSDINEYTLRYKITGNSWTNINNYTGTSYPLTTSPCSSYQFEVKANCEDASTTDWASISFSSLCQNATVNVSNLQVTTVNIFNPYVGLSWTRGNGDGMVILAKEVGTGNGTFDAPQNGTWYDGNANFSSASPLFAGSNTKVVYNGTGTSGNVIGLENGKTYLFKAYEYVGDSDENVIYLLQGSPLTNATIDDEPTIIANFDWYPVEILAGSPIEFSGFGDWVTDGSWAFNGANVSTPSGMIIDNVIFANPGIYDVTFTGTSSNVSGSSSITKSINVLDPNNLGPDLRVKSIVLSQSSVMQDTDIDVTITVQNIGTEDAIFPWTKHWLSIDGDLSANDYHFSGKDYQQSAAIQPQTEYTYTITLTIPDNGDWSNTGQNYIIVEADFPENIDETDETNNTKSKGLTIEAFLPDLTVSNINITPSTVASGANFTLDYTINSNPWGYSDDPIVVFLSKDNNYSTDDIAIAIIDDDANSATIDIPSYISDGNKLPILETERLPFLG